MSAEERLGELQKDFEEQIENIKAIKGEKYTDALNFIISLSSGITAIVAMLRNKPTSAEEAISMVMAMALEKSIKHNAIKSYLKAIGFNQEESKEVTEHAHKIMLATRERIQSTLKI